MSEVGQKRKRTSFSGMSALPPEADIASPPRHVRKVSKAALTAPKSDFRFAPESGRKSDIAGGPFCANNGLMRCINCWAYSITSSARASSAGGIAKPRAFAVFMLITNSNLLGCVTGSSAGLLPFRILST